MYKKTIFANKTLDDLKILIFSSFHLNNLCPKADAKITYFKKFFAELYSAGSYLSLCKKNSVINQKASTYQGNVNH